MPKGQSSLDSFFKKRTTGTAPAAEETKDDGPSSNNKRAATTITGTKHHNPPSDSVSPCSTTLQTSPDGLKDATEASKTIVQVESFSASTPEQVEVPSSEEVTTKKAISHNNNNNNKRPSTVKELRKKKRRIIEDDSSSDDDDDHSNRSPVPIAITTTTVPDDAPSSTEESKDDTKNNKSNVVEPTTKSLAPTKNGTNSAVTEVKEVSSITSTTATSSEEARPAVAGSSSSTNKTKSCKVGIDKKVTTASGGKSNKAPTLVQALKLKSDTTLLEEAQQSWPGYDHTADTISSVDPQFRQLPYAVLCQTWGSIEAITSRLQIQDLLTALFRQCLLLNVDLLPPLYLCSNAVAPAYQCVELGIGDAILIRAISEATGASPSVIKTQYESQGDLGNVAQTAKGSQRTLGGFFKAKTPKVEKILTTNEVLQVFQQIATTKGNQSQKWKVDCIKKLLVRATSKEESRYIIRSLQGKLRIGLAQSTVLISLAHALALSIPKGVVDVDTKDDDDLPEEALQYKDVSVLPEKRLEAAVAILKKAYSEVPSYEALVRACLSVPLDRLHVACTLTPGIPVAPMLAKPTKSIQEVLKRLNGLKFTCEYKYDGERAQVHLLPDGTTKVFSRNLLDTSEKYPEVGMYVKEASKHHVESFVMDTEVVAFDNKTGQLVPFQILSTRKKTEESAETAKVQVIVQAFDLMFLNGKSLLSSTLEERRNLLHQHFEAVPGKFQFATAMDHVENGDTTVIEDFLDAAIKGQCEGLMIKTVNVNANYEPSRRSLNWLKLKKDYLQGLGDSVDLVPLGAYYGRGKRTGVYGAYLLACYDPDTEEFQSVCKIGTGFSDEDLKTLAASLNEHIIPKKSSQYNTTDQLECDVWFDACQVWEVKAADLSKSSAHCGAIGKLEEGRGIGLRFPRFERLRDDKRPDQATTSDQILEMYYNQDTIIVGDNGADNDDDGI